MLLILFFLSKITDATIQLFFFSVLGTALDVSNKEAANLSTLYDVGGIFGGILAGFIRFSFDLLLLFFISLHFIHSFISDMTGMSALVCGASFVLTVPMVIK